MTKTGGTLENDAGTIKIGLQVLTSRADSTLVASTITRPVDMTAEQAEEHLINESPKPKGSDQPRFDSQTSDQIFFSARQIRVFHSIERQDIPAAYGYRATSVEREEANAITTTTLFQFPSPDALDVAPDLMPSNGVRIRGIAGIPDPKGALIMLGRNRAYFMARAAPPAIEAQAGMKGLWWKLAPPEFVAHYLRHLRKVANEAVNSWDTNRNTYEKEIEPLLIRTHVRGSRLATRAMQVALNAQGGAERDLPSIFAGFYSVTDELAGSKFDREGKVASEGLAEQWAATFVERVTQAEIAAGELLRTTGQSFGDLPGPQ